MTTLSAEVAGVVETGAFIDECADAGTGAINKKAAPGGQFIIKDGKEKILGAPDKTRIRPHWLQDDEATREKRPGGAHQHAPGPSAGQGLGIGGKRAVRRFRRHCSKAHTSSRSVSR